MRVYHSTSHRRAGASIEVEARWAGVQWLALGLLALLPFVARSPLGLFAVSLPALALYVFPARRRVLFDAGRRVVAIEHAGFLSEKESRTIPFADVRRVVLQRAGRKGGRPLFAAFARTGGERVYLFTHAGDRDTASLEREVSALLEEG